MSGAKQRFDAQPNPAESFSEPRPGSSTEGVTFSQTLGTAPGDGTAGTGGLGILRRGCHLRCSSHINGRAVLPAESGSHAAALGYIHPCTPVRTAAGDLPDKPIAGGGLAVRSLPPALATAMLILTVVLWSSPASTSEA